MLNHPKKKLGMKIRNLVRKNKESIFIILGMPETVTTYQLAVKPQKHALIIYC
jgi:hypothetical protein